MLQSINGVPEFAVEFNQQIKRLELISTFLESFHNADITYIHCGSRQHLQSSYLGHSDIDILFLPSQKEQLEALLFSQAFKKFEAPSHRRFEDIEDYIGLDRFSGKIVHLHAHFKLNMGGANFKNYKPDFEEGILQRRVFDDEFGIFRMDPATEVILLFFRQALKLRNRDKARILLNGKSKCAAYLVKEFDGLKLKCTDDKVKAATERILNDNSYIGKIVTGNFSDLALVRLASMLKKQFVNSRIYSGPNRVLIPWYREVYNKIAPRYARLFNKPIVLKRTNPRGGLVIALIGADGSGKSTLIEEIGSSFGKKLDVYRIYFGRGTGRMSWYRRVLVTFKKAARRIVNSGSAKEVHTGNVLSKSLDMRNRLPLKPNIYNCIEALMVAHEKSTNVRRMKTAKKKGMLVICDRFPQNQVKSLNDGPVLGHLINSSNWLIKAFARREAKLYKIFDHEAPDIVFKLIARAEIVEARKPGKTNIEMLNAKIEGIKQLKFPSNCKVITIDAEQPLDSVFSLVKTKIWEAYK